MQIFKKSLTLKIILFLVVSDIMETFVQFCFKKSALTQGGFDIKLFSDIVNFLFGVFSSWFLWLGLLAVVLEFIIWSTILSKVDLSVAVPVASFSYILVALVSIIFLHENVNLLRWAGIFFILIGVVFVSLSSKEKQEALS
jgi:drug/metabolite transporter (DMT)-like permease